MKESEKLRLSLNLNFSIVIESIEMYLNKKPINEQKHFILNQISWLKSQSEIEYYSYSSKAFEHGIIPYYCNETMPFIKKRMPKGLLILKIRQSDLNEYLQAKKELLDFNLNQQEQTEKTIDSNFQQFDFGYILNNQLIWTADNRQFAIVFHSIADQLNLQSFTGYNLAKQVEKVINDGKLRLTKEFNFSSFKNDFEKLNNDVNCYPVKIDLAVSKDVSVKSLINI